MEFTINTMSLAYQSRYVIIGAGIHDLSTAYHLEIEIRAKVLLAT